MMPLQLHTDNIQTVVDAKHNLPIDYKVTRVKHQLVIE